MSKILNLLLAFSVVLLVVVKNDEVLERQKRYLYFPLGGGTMKFVVSFAFPIQLGSKQSMALGYNLQWIYPLPQYPNQTRTWPPNFSGKRRKRHTDGDRAWLYAGLEKILDETGVNGRQCLLKSICENAMESAKHEANGVYGHLIHIALTPDYGDGEADNDLDPVYMDAKRAGEFGVDCGTLYTGCRNGTGLLETISYLHDR